MQAIGEILAKDPIMTHMEASDLSCEICDTCGEPKQAVFNFGTGPRRVPVMCSCKQEAYTKAIEEERNKEHMRHLAKLRAYSLMDEKFKSSTFENWEVCPANEKHYRLGMKYCESWEKMLKENNGMLLWGPPGTGKSYLSFCIANKLLDQGIPVIATSSINLINRIYDSYRNFGEAGEVEIIRQLQNASLLVLDDLGAEHSGKSGKEKQIIYSIVDARVRANMPLIITTNLNPQELNRKLTGDDCVSRTYDRIMELCAPLEVKGESRRINKAHKKTNAISKLMVG